MCSIEKQSFQGKILIVLFDSNLELFGGSLLDISKHYKRMKKEDIGRRGRPDILHSTLLTICDSPLYAENKIGIIIHTIEDRIIIVKENWRPPRNYNNFTGLMVQLLEKGQVPPKGNPILYILNSKGLGNFMEMINAKNVILFSSHGKKVTSLRETLRDFLRDLPVVFLIGAYAKGKPRQEIFNISTNVISICDRVLSSNYVACKLVCSLESLL